VYTEVPEEALAGIDLSELDVLVRRLVSPASQVRVSSRSLPEILSRLWRVRSQEWLDLAALERGFLSLDQCLSVAKRMDASALLAIANNQTAAPEIESSFA